MTKRYVSILTMLTMCASVSYAQQAEVTANVDSLTVGDRFELSLFLGHDGTREALFPHRLLPDSLAEAGGRFRLGDFEILSVLNEGGRPYDNGGRIDSVVYEATSFALDSAVVASITLGLASEVDTLLGEAPGITIPVASLVGADAMSIRDITPLAEFERPVWPWILGILALVAVILALWWYRRKGEPDTMEADYAPEPALPAFDEAMDRLSSLDSEDLSIPERIKPFYVELTDILRTYVGRRADVPALESTTRELLERLARTPAAGIVPSEVLGEIRHILSEADMVKFADWKPVPDSARSVVQHTRETISGMEEAYRREQAKAQAPIYPGGDGARGPEPPTEDWSSVPEGAWPRPEDDEARS